MPSQNPKIIFCEKRRCFNTLGSRALALGKTRGCGKLNQTQSISKNKNQIPPHKINIDGQKTTTKLLTAVEEHYPLVSIMSHPQLPHPIKSCLHWPQPIVSPSLKNTGNIRLPRVHLLIGSKFTTNCFTLRQQSFFFSHEQKLCCSLFKTNNDKL